MSTELAWAAGLFEGEGCVYVPPPDQGRGLRLTVAQSGEDDVAPPVLVRFQQAIGGGGVIVRTGPNALSKKQRWVWRLQRRTDSQRVLDMLAPYLTTPIVVRERSAA